MSGIMVSFSCGTEANSQPSSIMARVGHGRLTLVEPSQTLTIPTALPLELNHGQLLYLSEILASCSHLSGALASCSHLRHCVEPCPAALT
jgi:hypothetical protein